MHHAMRDAGSGFYGVNDAAIAMSWLPALGYQRSAYLDLDLHHSDGDPADIYDDPRLLTKSALQAPLPQFPATRHPEETGNPDPAPGSAINLALHHATDDSGWLGAFTAVVPR